MFSCGTPRVREDKLTNLHPVFPSITSIYFASVIIDGNTCWHCQRLPLTLRQTRQACVSLHAPEAVMLCVPQRTLWDPSHPHLQTKSPAWNGICHGCASTQDGLQHSWCTSILPDAPSAQYTEPSLATARPLMLQGAREGPAAVHVPMNSPCPVQT